MSQAEEQGFVERRNAGLKVVEHILSPEIARFLDGAADRGGFGSYMSELTLRNLFSELWARPGLDMRSRSLLTLGILIGLRSENEMRHHFAIALKNGLTVTEIEEILYHATGYIGFPGANIAKQAATEALKAEGAIP